MAVVAVSAVWAGVAGAAVGGLLAFMSSWLVHRSERAERISERSRGEMKEACAALLTSAEDSMHLFEWLVKDHYGETASKEDKAKADHFYDQEVTPRVMALRIIGDDEVVGAAGEMRHAINHVRHLIVDAEALPTKEEFRHAQVSYRARRRTFITLARADLERRASLAPSFLDRIRNIRF